MDTKLSDIFYEMIEPYKESRLEDLDKLLYIASCAWNMCVFPEKEGKKLHGAMLKTFKGDKETENAFDSLIGYFVKFKLERYGDDMRIIVKHRFDTSFNPPILEITSTQFGNAEEMPNIGGNKLSRNALCPCGSVKKYKKCCGG